MARKCPKQLHTLALEMHRAGHSAAVIADTLGLHPGALRVWLDGITPYRRHPISPTHPRRQTSRR